jgi:DNA polymerase
MVPEGFTRRLHLDYETASDLDLRKVGAYRYAEHPSTRILMLGWAVNDEPEQLWEPHKGPIPPELEALLRDPSVSKHAFNAAFERLITRHCLKIEVPYHEWRCTMVESYYLGFAGGLDQTLKAIGLETKDKRGSQLINTFCKPAPKNHKADWYDWANKPHEWEDFCGYCRQDIRVERQLYHWLRQFPGMHKWDWSSGSWTRRSTTVVYPWTRTWHGVPCRFGISRRPT